MRGTMNIKKDILTPLKKCNFERRLSALLLHERHRVFVLSNLLNLKPTLCTGLNTFSAYSVRI